MPPVHTSLLELPDILDRLGLNYMVEPDWEYGQGDYLWTTPDGHGSYDNPPSAYMVHHTAGTSATPPPADLSKANAWVGLWDGLRLRSSGPGTPMIFLSTAGPCRTSSGYGYRPAAWDYSFQDRRAPVNAEGPDTDTALNRYAFNVETVHPGDGSAIDPGVWGHVVGLGVALHLMYGWEERTLGHLSWTGRKIDPRWSVGLPNDGTDCIIDVQDAIARELEDVDYRGVKNVPDESWARNVVDYGIDDIKIIREDVDNDWVRNVDYGSLWTLFQRYDKG